MTRIFLIEDTTGGAINKIVDTEGLISYANDAHFVEKDTTKPIDTTWQVYACKDIKDAICILQADLFHVQELFFENTHIYSVGG